jgi:nucleotide-binding universal stress UspA family protein
MKDLRKILCPVDTSSFPQRALRHGVALGKRYGAEFVALLVSPVRFPPALGLADPASVPPEPSDNRAIAAESLGAFIRSAADPGAIKAMVRSGQIAPEIPHW